MALAITAILAACQKDENPPADQDPEVPEQPQDPVIPSWEKIEGLPDLNFASLALVDGKVLALGNQHLYVISPGDWTFSKREFENPNYPNVTRSPITPQFFASIKGPEVTVYSTQSPQLKTTININDYLGDHYALTAAYPFAPAELAISQENKFLLVCAGADPETSNIPNLVSFRAQMPAQGPLQIFDVRVVEMEDLYSTGDYNLIYPAGDNFIFSIGPRTYTINALGEWQEMLTASIHSVIPYKDLLLAFGQNRRVWVMNSQGTDWTEKVWEMDNDPYLINPRGVQLENLLVQSVAGGISVVNPGLSGSGFEHYLFSHQEMGLPEDIIIEGMAMTETHLVISTTEGIFISPIEDFLQK